MVRIKILSQWEENNLTPKEVCIHVEVKNFQTQTNIQILSGPPTLLCFHVLGKLPLLLSAYTNICFSAVQPLCIVYLLQNEVILFSWTRSFYAILRNRLINLF